LLVDSDELAFRGYDAEDLIAEVEPVPRLKIVETLVKADSVLSF
jgi:sulfur relay (sulfurtransferase) DsrF/TusC family protein